MSAWIWRQRAFRAPPPDTRICSIATPISRISSRLSRIANVAPSSRLRIMWGRPWRTVSPIQAALASGSKWGVRSPVMYGRKNRPSAPTPASAASPVSRKYGSSPRSLASATSALPSSLRNH